MPTAGQAMVPYIPRYKPAFQQALDGGVSATIGVQSSGSGSHITYRVNQANAVPVGTSATTSPTLILSFDTNTGTMTQAAG
ncbi:unnamed protein product [Rotaria sordida]|uniref:Uncharacterized protein n=1 Tax=Rotaria sordida TaxID=392033 RepID=A0A814VJN8_9BILA|nr:unnamed protein product [Rotaria sordida]CAF1210370.1 unnamed protein product [Rotaria sordida]CAF4072727.1 unnamed protein product [Rotaria sordida]